MKDGIPELQTIGHVLSSVSGRTALHYAARNGMEQIIVKLLSEKKVEMVHPRLRGTDRVA
jgi:hypothetical protein